MTPSHAPSGGVGGSRPSYAPVPVPASLSQEEVRRRLSRWVATRDDAGEDARVVNVRAPAAIGGSNELYVVDVELPAQDLVETVVVKLEPTGYQLYLDPRYDQAVRLLEVLERHPVVPAPRLRWSEDDPSWLGTRFYVMSFLDGSAPPAEPAYPQGGWMTGGTPSQREGQWRDVITTVAAVHRVPQDEVAFVCDVPDGVSGLAEHLNYQLDALAWATDGSPPDVATRTADWLRTRLPEQAASTRELSWGDARVRNMLFRDWRVTAVLDWDMVSLAGPLTDLGYLLFFDHRKMGWDHLEGVGSRSETIALWESLTERSASDVSWYEAFAGFRLMVQRMRKNSILRTLGQQVPVEADRDNEYVRLTQQVIAEAEG